MIIGAYYLTELVEGDKGEGRVFGSVAEVERAYEAGDISLHAKISLARPTLRPAQRGHRVHDDTLGRFLFNECLPDGFGYITEPVTKKQMGEIVDRLANELHQGRGGHEPRRHQGPLLQLRRPVRLTISIDDVKTPAEKRGILDDHEKEADKVEKQFRRGIITDGERRQKEVEIWTNATDEVREAMERGSQGRAVQPHRHDGGLGCPREHDAGPPDRRHARPGGQPPRRHDPSPDQVATSVRASRCSSTSSPRRAPGRASSTPPCVPPTRATSPVASSTSPRS